MEAGRANRRESSASQLGARRISSEIQQMFSRNTFITLRYSRKGRLVDGEMEKG